MLYFLLRSVCPIANARKEVIGHFPKEKRIKRKAKVGGSAQCQRSIKNPKDYGIMARQIRSFAKLILLPCHPSGLIPFPFGFFATPPIEWLSFFSVFFFVKKFWFSATTTKKAELISKVVRYESR
ncbi:hypothetical protein [Pseudopedobacter saltans]|uniref:hypothetical protein n=1 Tax=Pseudopedobacter saltans TaxID=151895 RepID=UPI00059EFF7D|nr:hypothetical protein [Pseudopedobacter saltans]